MKILRRAITSLIVLLIVVSGSAMLLTRWSAFGWKALSVPTGSMRPTMPPGSLALMHRVSDSSLQVGDVITYTNPLSPKSTISHRIIKKYLIDNKIPAFITKGDANPSPDAPVVEGLVQGQVVWHVRDVGAWLLWSKTLLGIAILVYIPSLLIIVEEVTRLNDYYKRWQPYRLLGYSGRQILEESRRWAPKAAMGLGVFAALIFAASAYGPRVEALLGSNTVTLAPNNLAVAASTSGGGGNKCPGTTNNNTNISVNNSSTQTATSGNAASSGNTTGGSASSGSASNSNSTTITIGVTNCQ